MKDEEKGPEKGPIDLLKYRTDKLLESEKRKHEAEGEAKELGWSGANLAAAVESITLTPEIIKGVKTFMFVISKRLKEVKSLKEVNPQCLGLALLLLRDYDRQGFEKLLKMVQEQDG